MHKDTNNQLDIQEFLTLSSIQEKKVELSISGQEVSSDGGLLLLKEVENQIGIIKAMSNCITDMRDQRYVEHTLYNTLSQRIYQIAAGYEDANDCDTMRNDSILKMCSNKLPQTDGALASQPTMCRLENSISRSNLYSIAKAIALNFVLSYTTQPELIILDCDDTNHDAHGGQQGILYNDYYGEYCFMPLHIYEGLSGKLITTILKPGRRSKGVDVFNILKRVISFLRIYWKDTIIAVRGDSHFCSQALMDWAEKQRNVHFLTGLSSNSVLKKLSAVTVKSAEDSYKKDKKDVKIYHSFDYKAESWTSQQRVIVKVEVTNLGTNVRYIVTDLRQYRTRTLYEIGYCGRGRMELFIKEHKTYLKSDRTSCNKFEANQFRLFMHSAAYILINALQKNVLVGTQYANSTMKTIQLKIIKVAATVKELKTKIKIELPKTIQAKQVIEKVLGIFEILRC
jgi:hypothetical protein